MRLVHEDLLLHLPLGSFPRQLGAIQAGQSLSPISLSELLEEVKVGAGHGPRPAVFEDAADGNVGRLKTILCT